MWASLGEVRGGPRKTQEHGDHSSSKEERGGVDESRLCAADVIGTRLTAEIQHKFVSVGVNESRSFALPLAARGRAQRDKPTDLDVTVA
jgi:hypothetical protein